MTTKKFQVSTTFKGLEDVTFTCDNRADAIAYITNTLMGNSQINPQDLILEEIEVVDNDATLSTTAVKIETSLSIFNVKVEIHKLMTDGDGFIEIQIDTKYPSLSLIEIRRIIKVIDEVNADLPEGYEVFFSISHECAIRLFLSTPKDEK